MELTSKQNIQNLLEKRGLRPLKRFGQNFIIDEKVLEKVVVSADLDAKDVVLEIGPGIGTLTQELAKRAKKVIAVEKDRAMIEILKETLKDFENVEIVQGDIRESDFPFNFKGSRTPFKYKIVGNLPFYLTAPVIRKFLESRPVQPGGMTLVVQKEVAQRICAKPPKMSILANSVQFYANAEIVSDISKKSFWPEPKVDAAIIKITPHPKLAGSDPASLFFKIMKAGFLHPRKQLLNNLSKGLKMDREKVEDWLLKNNIRPTRRAETLSVDDWLNLTKTGPNSTDWRLY